MPACATGAADRRSPAPSACSIASRPSASPPRCSSTRCAAISASERRARPAGAPGSVPMAAMRVLGIDPGLRTTGFGVVDCDGGRLGYVASGTIRTAAVALADLPGRLGIIFHGVREIAARYAPTCASIEIVFVNVNPQATLLLGQARGAALSALVSHELAVAEYTALQMKRAIVGHGQAKKEQVQQMVMRLLSLPGLPGPDAADALGLAICHAHAARSFAAIARSATLAPRTSGRYK